MNNGEKWPGTALLGRLGGRSRWFVGELVVIVAGVLIALAIDEWRGERDDANLEIQYLRQLIVDLQRTEERIAAIEARAETSEGAASRFLAAFEGGKPVTRQDAGLWLSEMRLFSTPVPVLGTVEALIFTGDLRLIRDSNARSEITQYLSSNRNRIDRIFQYEELSRNLYIQILILAQTHGISPGHRSGFSYDPPGSEAGSGFTAFFANPEAYALVERFVSNKSRMAMQRESMSEEAARLRELLQAQL